MNVGLPEITMILALLAGLASLGIGMFQFVRGRSQVSAPKTAETELADLIRAGEERLASMVAMMDASQQARIDALRSDISSVRAEIDWLTGEQMIEQAITMARGGVSADEISAELGLSQEAAETLHAMRIH